MIILKSKLKVIDNSGADFVECIKIYKKKQNGLLGDYILVVVQKLSYKRLGLKKIKKSKLIKKGTLFKGLIVQLKKPSKRFDGNQIIFNKNSVLLLNNQLNLVGTRISGILPLEILLLKDNKKYVSLAPIIL